MVEAGDTLGWRGDGWFSGLWNSVYLEFSKEGALHKVDELKVC